MTRIHAPRVARAGFVLALSISFLSPETTDAMEPIDVRLIDVEQNVRIPHWSFGEGKWQVTKDVLHGGRQEGVDRIRVDNGVLQFSIIPTRGMNLWDARCGDLRLGWDSPVEEVVHPQFVNLNDRGGLGWLEGFGEWINRCGLASNGSPGTDQVPSNTGAMVPVELTLHGKVSYLPARRVGVTVERGTRPVIRVSGEVDETMMFGTQLRLRTTISTEVGSKSLTLSESVTNRSAGEQEFQLLYHINFGAPLLEDGARVVAPLARVSPRDARAAEDGMDGWDVYGPPTAGYVEQVFFLEPIGDADGQTEVLLKNRAGDRGVSIRFSTRELPCLTVWKNTAALEDGYVTGIEPATNYPNLRGFERQNGRVPVLAGGEAHDVKLTLTALTGADEVEAASARIRKLQGAVEPRVDRAPVPELSP